MGYARVCDHCGKVERNYVRNGNTIEARPYLVLEHEPSTANYDEFRIQGKLFCCLDCVVAYCVELREQAAKAQGTTDGAKYRYLLPNPTEGAREAS